jgi:hypothetical protein
MAKKGVKEPAAPELDSFFKCRLTSGLKHAFYATAARDGIDPSKFVRDAITQYVVANEIHVMNAALMTTYKDIKQRFISDPYKLADKLDASTRKAETHTINLKLRGF